MDEKGIGEAVRLLVKAVRLLGEKDGDLDVQDVTDKALEVLGL